MHGAEQPLAFPRCRSDGPPAALRLTELSGRNANCRRIAQNTHGFAIGIRQRGLVLERLVFQRRLFGGRGFRVGNLAAHRVGAQILEFDGDRPRLGFITFVRGLAALHAAHQRAQAGNRPRENGLRERRHRPNNCRHR